MNNIHFQLNYFAGILLLFLIHAPLNGQTFTSDPNPNTVIPDDGCFDDIYVEDTLSVSGLSGTLGTDIFISKVCINITHTYDDDVEVFLVGPDGYYIELVTDEGDDGDNFTNTCFSDLADKSIHQFEPPFTGLFLPDEDIYDLYGQSPNGMWILVVCDDNDFDDTPGTLNDWSITFVEELCQGPDPVLINPGFGGVSLKWSSINPASTYLIEYGISGFDQGSGTFLETTDTTLLLTGLVSDTSYKLYSYSICDGDTIEGTVKTFNSGCGTVITGEYFEGFTWDGIHNYAACWEDYEGSSTILEGPLNIGTTRWEARIFAQLPGNSEGVAGRVFVENEVDWLVSPYIDISDGDYVLSFDMALNDLGCNWCDALGGMSIDFYADDSVGVAITTDTGKTWKILMAWDSSDIISPFGQYESIDLSTYTGAVQFGFFYDDGSILDFDTRTWSIDNFRISKYPDCTFPFDLSTSEYTLDGATLHWSDTSGATEWDLEIGAVGFVRSGIPTHTSTQTSLEWHGGQEMTEYDFYVRGNCASDSVSSWSGPHRFCTLTDTFYHNFDDIYPAIYDCYSSLSYAFTPSANAFIWHYDFNMVGIDIQNDFDNEAYIISILPPFYYHPGSEYTLQFSVKGEFDLELGYMTNPFDSSTFESFDTIQVNANFDTISISDTFSMGRIAFKPIMNGMTYKSTIIDDIRRTRVGGSPCAYNLNITGMPMTDTYKATSNITSDALILSGRSILFKAGGVVLLNENFEVQPGASFEASGGIPCPD